MLDGREDVAEDPVISLLRHAPITSPFSWKEPKKILPDGGGLALFSNSGDEY
jgi:hypothetical protein